MDSSTSSTAQAVRDPSARALTRLWPAGLRSRGGLSWVRTVLAFAIYAVGLLAVWELGVAISGVQPFVLPPPTDVIEEFVDNFSLLLSHSWVTIGESLAGFAIAVVIGVALALMLAYWNWARVTILPTMVLFESVPKVALAPIIVIWCGIGLASKVAMVATVCVFPIFMATVRGLTTVSVDYLDLMRAARARKWQVFVKVRVPFAVPHFFTGVKIAVPVAMVGAVIGEFVSAQEGLGYLILSLSNNLQTATSLAAIAMVTIWSFLLFRLVLSLESLVARLFPTGEAG
jgi:NitT/TauT family transport system permease protein